MAKKRSINEIPNLKYQKYMLQKEVGCGALIHKFPDTISYKVSERRDMGCRQNKAILIKADGRKHEELEYQHMS